MKVQGHLMQAHFIEIHQIFTKKMLDTFLTEWYICETALKSLITYCSLMRQKEKEEGFGERLKWNYIDKLSSANILIIFIYVIWK